MTDPQSRSLPTSLARPRLRRLVLDAPRPRVCTVLAPAGFGKSMLLAEVAARHEGRSVLLAVDGSMLAAGSLLDGVRCALAARNDERPGTDVRPALIAIDDVHLLVGSGAEDDLRTLVRELAPSTHLLLGGRVAPELDLHRFRLANELLELGANDLRFRSWEVEELFHHVFRVRLPPQELSTLAAVTEGWAAGLQLYRHTVARSPEGTRRHELERLRQCRLETVRSYLAANVLASLDDDLRAFAVRSSVLGRMDPQVCNQLLGRSDSARCLDRLVDQQLFTVRRADGSYRYHEVFRSFLEAELASSTDRATLVELYRSAATLLEARGAVTDAARAHVMAGNSAEATRLFGEAGAVPADGRAWSEALPDGLLTDQWLRLAQARLVLQSGRPGAALDAFTKVAAAPGSPEAPAAAAREAERLRRWLQPDYRPADPSEWSSLVRVALQGRPTPERDDLALPPTPAAIVTATGHLLEGRPDAAASVLDRLAPTDAVDADATIASALRAISWWLAEGVDPTDVLTRLRDETDAAQQRWSTRILRACLLAFPFSDDAPIASGLRQLDDEAARDGDPWTAPVARFAVLLGAAQGTLRSDDLAVLDDVVRSAPALLDAVGAPVLRAWSTVVTHVLSVHGHPQLRPAAPVLRAAEDDLPIASGIAQLLGRDDARRLEPPLLSGLLGLVGRQRELHPVERMGTRHLAVRCFGTFELVVDGVPVALDALRPQALSLLHRLAHHVGQPVHRDVLLESMWPGADPGAAGKRLHAAVSAIRTALPEASTAVQRRGESYVLGGDGWAVSSDFVEFQRCAQAFAQACRRGDGDEEEATARWLIALHAGPLLADAGLSEWAVAERAQAETILHRAVERLARRCVEQGHLDEAIRHLESGLRLDRFRDELWTLLLELLERTDRRAELERARRSYRSVLDTLGVTT